MSAARASAVLAVVVVAVALAFPVAGPARRSTSTDRVSIFYYPWYSTPARDGRWEHWYVERDGAPVLSTAYYPSRGLYSSSNAKVVNAQMREIAAAGADTVVVSWWGAGSPEDVRLPLVATTARRYGLSVAVHVEPYLGRTPSSAVEDMARIHEESGVTDFYVYDVERDPASAWAEALGSLSDVRVFGRSTLVGWVKAAEFDGLYTYDVGAANGSLFRRLCTQAHHAGLLCAPSVGPGYDARFSTGQEVVRPRRNGQTYDAMWRTAIRSGADIVSVTSYNEWQEGTQIEPAREQVGRPSYEGAWGRHGLAAQRAYLAATAGWAARLRAARGQ